MTKEAFENAIAVVMALGGSTNAVLHLLAIAREAEVDLTLDDFNRVGDEGPAPRRPQAVRPLRDERRRQDRRHPGRDEGAARRRAAARRLPHRHRQDDGREPRGARPARRRRRHHPRAVEADPQDRRAHHPQGLAGPRGRGREVGRLRRRGVRGDRPGLRRRARRDGRPGGRADQGQATSW